MAIRVRSDEEGYPILPGWLDFYNANGELIRCVVCPVASEFRFERPTPRQPIGAAYRVLIYEKPAA